MDKLKLVLDFFKKYLFWFIFTGTIILVLVCWWMSTTSLAKSFLQEQVKIKKKFDEVKAIDDEKQQHPTQDYIKAVNEKNQKLKEGVLKVWEALYKEQKDNNTWPEEVLGEAAAKKIDKMGPDEKIPAELRERYQNYIKGYFPTLYKIIDLRHPADAPEGGGGNAEPVQPRQIMGLRIPMIGRRAAANVENENMVGTVEWDDNDRTRLEDRFNWKTRPDSDVIRIKQEDLWVYKTLLQVIRDTNNEGDPEHPLANVKRIEWIQIGADAISSWSAADQSVFKAGEAAPGNPRDARSAPAGRDAGAAAAESKEALLKDRYVDDKGVGLDAEAKQPYSEFKMMPISMKLHMDQRKISKLLVACVTSPMPIEVRRVRIRPGAGGELLDAGATGAAASTGGGGRDYNRRTVDRGPARAAAAGGGGEEGAAGSYEIPVEIQGIIYIYNEPDKNTLGTGTVGEIPAATAPGAEPGAPGATPDAAPAKP
jgi:hypothetical protein